jgi:protein ImuB
MIVCVHLPRFELVVAAGGPDALSGRALALAPPPGREHPLRGGGLRLGEVSGAAEACGVRAGMPLGEGLARCPDLVLVPPNPLAVAETWEAVVRALEGIGAELELARPGMAYFDARGLRGLYGGEEGVLTAARRAIGRPVRLGGGPTRLCALAAALRARARRPALAGIHEGASRDGAGPHPAGGARRYLAPLSVSLLGHRAETEALVQPLQRLGVHTMSELAALPRAAVADRFGEPGIFAHRLAHGQDTPLRPRRAQEHLEESLTLPESASGQVLQRALGVLIDRLLAQPARRGRTLRAVILAARLAGGGTWRERVVFREATADPERMRLAASARLALLPAPADLLRLGVDRFGPPGNDQRALLDEALQARRRRLHEAVRQVRAVAGPHGALRALCIDPDSRIPERRMMLTPFEGEEG